jgi:hypothetical protein
MLVNTYSRHVAITKSDTIDIDGNTASVTANAPTVCDAIYVGGAGVVAVVTMEGTVVNYTAVAGGVLPVLARRVNSTNTTATLMVALYE